MSFENNSKKTIKKRKQVKLPHVNTYYGKSESLFKHNFINLFKKMKKWKDLKKTQPGTIQTLTAAKKPMSTKTQSLNNQGSRETSTNITE